MTFKQQPFRAKALKPIALTVSTLLEPLWASQAGFAIRLMKAWPTILGKPWCEESFPEKLIFPNNDSKKGILTLHIWGGRAVEFQYQMSFLLDRLNSYFGYQAIERIVFKQTLTPPQQKVEKSLIEEKMPLKPAWSESIQQVPEDSLQKALQSLGEALLK